MDATTVDSKAPATPPATTPAEPTAKNLSLDQRMAATKSTIETHSLVALSVGLIPVPGVDIVALSAVQVNLLRKLGDFYGYTLTEQLGKKLAGAVIGAYAPAAIATPVASLLKIVPLVGQFAGAAAVSLTAGASTYALGKVFVQHFESGGTFLDFNPASVEKHFERYFAEGKNVLKDAAPTAKKG
ncbi:YcjF family protein [Parachitinimonas caeni]|uniref:DUF697 domain-containing protein n=1 Tax=Parachitinimonas caeni TaxID=3031301 RepID=A0ABT7DWF3_9NEIS|nr:DUF697 domain-containing protein [Parachitinimonas caeni]MDK2124396.1 DUF697 domain-containing protein [Parachitinimonas caeni]